MAETATEAREQAQEKAKQTASKASDAARSQIDERSTQLGERVHSTAGDIRTVGEQLREQGKDQPAKLADQAAGHVERVGNWLRDSDSDRLLSDVEDFGRRQPWALALGGLAIGFAAARFLKASSTQRYERQQSQALEPSTSGNGQPSFGAPGTGTAGIDGAFSPPAVPPGGAGIPDVGPTRAPEALTDSPDVSPGSVSGTPTDSPGSVSESPAGIPESRTGVPRVSPADTRRTLGSTPPPPSGGTKGR